MAAIKLFQKGLTEITRAASKKMRSSAPLRQFSANSNRVRRAVATPGGAVTVAVAHTLGTLYAFNSYRNELLDIRNQNIPEREKQKLALLAGFNTVAGRFGSLTTPSREVMNIIEDYTGVTYVHPLEGLRSTRNNNMTVLQEIEQNQQGV